jgi:hypothetical protein
MGGLGCKNLAGSRSASRTLVLGLGPILLSGCCIYGVWGVAFDRAEGYDDPHGAGPPAFYQVGDTVTLVAREAYCEADCHDPAGPSDLDPLAYEWSSSDLSIASMLAPGRVYFSGLGRFQLTVATSHAVARLDGRVFPRIAAVRLTPSHVTIPVGDTVSFLVEALDGNGSVIAEVGRPTGSVRIEQSPLDLSEPIAGNQAESDGVHFVYRGYHPGTVTLTARLPIYRVFDRTATAILVVR